MRATTGKPRWLRRSAFVLIIGLALAACTGAKQEESAPTFTGDQVETPGDEPTNAPASGGDGPTRAATDEPTTNPIVEQPAKRGGAKKTSGGAKKFVSTLFSEAEDTVGITDTEIRLCIHAALTYGAAFNTGEDDLNVYWDAVNAAGGIYGRTVNMQYENDNYSPDTARQAVTACKDSHDPFMVLGGIGFDQIPAVREWAEANRMLYLHHTATVQGTQGKRFSFSSYPSTEKMGEMFAELAISTHGKDAIGIVKRGSDNWEPGVRAFKKLAAKHDLNIAVEREVSINQGNYLNEVIALRDAQVDLVWVWLNALETTEFVKQARAQNLNAVMMVFPFNLESQTLDDDALDPRMIGVGMYQAYSHADLRGEFRKYEDDLREFQAHYAQYRPSADLDGVGGDLIFGAWSGFKALHRLLVLCGPDCTRNRIVETLHDLKDGAVSSFCTVDYSRADEHVGGYRVSIMQTYRAPDGKVNWRNTHTCVEHLL